MITKTENLRIIQCDQNLLLAAIKGNAVLESYLNVHVPDNWTEFGISALQYSASKLADNDETGWWTYFPVHIGDNELIGSGGYKGKPTEDCIVEIGYEIASDYRNKGLATEFVTVLIKNAFISQKVKTIIAYTLGEDNASTKVLAKCGFVKTDEINNPEDGLVWMWELKK